MNAYHPERLIRITVCFMFTVAILAPSSRAQSPKSVQSAELQGCVRDRREHPITGATVYLHSSSGWESVTARTDSEGSYHFPQLAPGSYRLEVRAPGYGAATFDHIELADKETKKVDVVLELKSSQPASSPVGPPEFFDEPKFTVAGVTDPTSLGGHGSNASRGTSESLEKGIAVLGAESTASSRPRVLTAATEQALHEKAEREPGNFEANHTLGQLLLEDGRPREAVSYLERATHLNPGNYENSYQLALAYAGAADYERARQTIQSLLAAHDRAELHHLLGSLDEKLNDPLAAVREYQRAAELEPSETNLFDWATELLIHRAAEPGVQVFTKGHRLFPHSVRMLAGLGVASYAQGAHEEAARRLCEASDLNPRDPTPYLLLGKMLGTESTESQEVAAHLERFARLEPENAQANFYYALSLWKRRTNPSENVDEVKRLLEKAISLDPKLSLAYLQLGIVHSENRDFGKAISAYQKALEINDDLEEAHYRLGQAYAQAGDNLKAQREIQRYKEISKQNANQAERERRKVRQFLYTLQTTAPASPLP